MQIRTSDAKRSWPQLRRLGNLAGILHLLGGKYKTSLLADYLCLKPWVARPEPGGCLFRGRCASSVRRTAAPDRPTQRHDLPVCGAVAECLAYE